MQKEANAMLRHRDRLAYDYTSLEQNERLAILKLNAELEGKKNSESTDNPTLSAIEPSNVNTTFNQIGEDAAAAFISNVDDLLFETKVIDPSLVEDYQSKFPGGIFKRCKTTCN